MQVRFYDTGCGIPADRLQTIFDDFMTTKRRGLGLGLAISGRSSSSWAAVTVASGGRAKGTTFVLEFPETAARPMPAAGRRIKADSCSWVGAPCFGSC